MRLPKSPIATGDGVISQGANWVEADPGYDQVSRMAELRSAELSARGLDPRTETKQIPEVTLYVRSNFGTITAIDAETGHEKWTTQAGKIGYPSYGVAASDDYVVAISSTTVHLLDAKTGQLLETHDSDFLPTATPTIDGKYVYVPTRNGVVRVLSAEDLGRLEYTLGSTGAITSSITIGSDTVSWTSGDGQVNVATAGQPGTKFRFQSGDDTVASPAFMDGKLFAGSLDGFVYAISESTGDTLWNYSAGGPIQVSPMAIGGSVYVTTENGQTTSLDAETGNVNWLASGVEQFVAASDSRLYCVTSTGDLAVLDTATGGSIASTPISPIGTVSVNTNTDRIYVIGKNGVLQCLRERGRRWPIARMSPRGTPAVEEVAVEAERDVQKAAGQEVPSAQFEKSSEGGEFDAFSEDTAVEADDSMDEEDPFGDEIGFGDDSGFDDGGDVGMDDENPFGE